MRIRTATHEDKAALAELHAASIRALCAESYDAAQVEAWTAALRPEIYDEALEHKVFLVAEEGGALVGLGILDAGAGILGALYVAPGSAGRGVGSALLAELERAASGGGVFRLTAPATLNARGFYARHGYRARAEARHTLPDGTHLACVKMVKDLPEPR